MTLTLFLVLLVGFFILPNLFNQREKEAFSSEYRQTERESTLTAAKLSDSVTLAISTFYDRGNLVHYLLGSEYRDVWSFEVTFPVWKQNSPEHRFRLGEAGGGEQTVSLDVIDQNGRIFTLRSVNKDQSRALPAWLQYSLARPLFRDQASSLNPYAAPVVARLADYAGIPHTNPRLYFIPYLDQAEDEKNELIAGRVMLMEEEADESWNYSERFGSTVELLDTEDMLKERDKGNYWVDSLLFAQCRIFDVIIGDWDRHSGQWVWACDTISRGCTPLPVDRDMAFYDFRDGIIDQLALQLAPKFQSFDSSLNHIDAYTINGGDLQRKLLGNLTEEQWLLAGRKLQESLHTSDLSIAFRLYPDPVYDLYGTKHERILTYRLKQTSRIASSLYTLTVQPVSE